ncbi:hypothetical protein [Alicyclobacillus ferrooxydans]|uniref:Uncharacterized protein n=1 Tax=Alicyclobacillus ferrooxydans TaxID=471514 RepID=A0A0P9CB62_9BACL|nr:hypothetical protein [Alicyclobacillus ferrooxydans]KPV42676.1 hypothetical protein AN477_16215 [Alicyclobacillus ferrooxydans]
MYTYSFRFANPRINDSYIRLSFADVEYPFQLHFGDVVILSETMVNEIHKHQPNHSRIQFWVGAVHHFVDAKDNHLSPEVFLVDYKPYTNLHRLSL